MKNDSIAIKGGVLVFALCFGAGRKIHTLSTGTINPAVIGLLSILLVPAIGVLIYCACRLFKASKKPVLKREKISEMTLPAAYILSIVLGLVIGFTTHNPS